MKKVRIFINAICFFAIVILLTSCSNDSNPASGSLFIKFTYNASFYSLPSPTTANTLSKTIDAFEGADATLNRVSLYMPLDVTLGAHAMTPDPSDVNAYGAYYIYGPDGVDILASNGSITITKITDEFVLGTFYFSGVSGTTPINVTEGSFKAYK